MKYTRDDYPMAERNADTIFTPAGKNIKDITFENLQNGEVVAEDCRTSKTSLLAQADIAESSGDIHLANNFRRAAEMIDIDSDRIIEIYNCLRPYRSTEEELLAIVKELREKYNAEKTAEFIEEAIYALKKRSKLKGDR